MKIRLQLKYKEQANRKVSAAFVRGASVTEWLREMDTWGISPNCVTCFVIPQSIRSVEASGLLVIFGETVPQVQKIKSPYGLIGGKLFIPLHSELQPEVTNSELKTLLVWDAYVLHPSIGLVGFEMKDRVELADVLECGAFRDRDWRKAHPGNAPLPPLTEIGVEKKTAEEIIEEFKKELGTKPLDEIPKKDEEQSAAKKFFNKVGRGMLKGGLFLTDALGGAGGGSAASSGGGSAASAGSASSPSSGKWFGRLRNWMHKTLEDLERERDTELRRLLNLFDQDTDEALAYAIPLNSPYASRGTAPPSSTLSRRDARFNLGGLGGGRPSDVWNADRYYADLRRKYEATAKKELDAGNYMKAAYVYAHLLGDFSSAARVLEQGKLYREAAALYKDHLKNVPAAAACLENGGLLLEAIELYKTLDKNEKVGDLYKTLGRKVQAEQHYSICVNRALGSNDYLDAARIQQEKLEDPKRAQTTLLEGWDNSAQAEQCLARYFELSGNRVEGKSVAEEIRFVYTHHTPKTKRNSLVNVLVPVFNKNEDEEVKDLARNIAYEIASEQAEEGNNAGLQMLRSFLPGDRLISSDTSRYIYRNRSQSKFSTPLNSYRLELGVAWVSALTWRNQFLAFGMIRQSQQHDPSVLRMVRGNWEEFWDNRNQLTLEYLSWQEQIPSSSPLSAVTDAHYTNLVVLYTGAGHSLSAKTLASSQQFDQTIYLGTPRWLPKGLLGMTIFGEHKLAALYTENNVTQLAFYHMSNGALINSIGCSDGEGKPIYMAPESGIRELIYRNDHFYFAYGAFLVRFTMNGEMEAVNLQARIHSIAAADHHTAMRLVACTDHGCVLVRTNLAKKFLVSKFVSEDKDAQLVQYIPDGKVVVAGDTEAIVYDLLQDNLSKRCTIQTEKKIVAILQVSRRNFCAIFEENGRISMHDLANG